MSASGQWSTADIPDLSGKTFLVTGANSGIGFEAVKVLAAKGGSVVLACRNQEKGRAALEQVRQAAGLTTPKLYLEALDLGDLQSIHAFADKMLKDHPRIDVLINNAGIMAIPRQTTKDGFETQIGTNHLGHFALTGLLLGRVVESAPSRVVTVSSLAHTMGKFRALDAADLRLETGYTKWGAYGRSKLANLLFAYELERRLEAKFPGVLSVACHPGYAATNLQAVGPEMTGSVLGKAFMSIGNAVFAQSAGAGALPTLYAATAPDVRGGDFIGPGGPFKMMGAPVKQNSNRLSHDRDAARKLWDTSAQVTGVDYAVLQPAPARAAS
ncbi:MAG TPA: oxidoreductase [Polyangiaceae bacterium]|jgi:NAD(P)-dependent dehydrogenase (short-subunit alcohol dehydrogenase family)|nr:oxidoreductase [Polyangiaceae bacterium]